MLDYDIAAIDEKQIIILRFHLFFNPIFQLYAGHPAEFTGVVCDYDKVSGNSLSCDLNIVRSDGKTFLYEICPDSPGDNRIALCKWNNLKR